MQENGSVLWRDIPKNRMLRWHPNGGGRVWRQLADFVNGHTREPGGSLLYCSHGRRAVLCTRFGPDLAPLGNEIVVDRYEGKRLNSPNDVVAKSDGTIWFTALTAFFPTMRGTKHRFRIERQLRVAVRSGKRHSWRSPATSSKNARPTWGL